jgi:uncharacterized membrane protein
MRNGLFDTNRLEAFSDAVIAIMLTVMIIEIDLPKSTDFSALLSVLPSLLAYLLSFTYIAIYWNNHHHLFKAAKGVNGAIMWSNMGLLFCLTLIPFTTNWMGENYRAVAPAVAYGFALLACAITYYQLQRQIVATMSKDSSFVQSLGADYKGKLSPLFYLTGIALAFVDPILAHLIYVGVALWWIVPDKRIERALNE